MGLSHSNLRVARRSTARRSSAPSETSFRKQKKSDASAASSIPSQDILEYSEKLSKMSMSEDSVAKVCPDRIYSITTFPSDALLVAAGDKSGNLGLWSVDDDSQASEATDGVVLYKPHSSTINRLAFDHRTSSKLYSFSYDGSVRCMDIVKGVFDQSFALPADEDGGNVWFQHGAFSKDGSLFVGDSSGKLLWQIRGKEQVPSLSCTNFMRTTKRYKPLTCTETTLPLHLLIDQSNCLTSASLAVQKRNLNLCLHRLTPARSIARIFSQWRSLAHCSHEQSSLRDKRSDDKKVWVCCDSGPLC